jgi:hypothetical protein
VQEGYSVQTGVCHYIPRASRGTSRTLRGFTRMHRGARCLLGGISPTPRSTSRALRDRGAACRAFSDGVRSTARGTGTRETENGERKTVVLTPSPSPEGEGSATFLPLALGRGGWGVRMGWGEVSFRSPFLFDR